MTKVLQYTRRNSQISEYHKTRLNQVIKAYAEAASYSINKAYNDQVQFAGPYGSLSYVLIDGYVILQIIAENVNEQIKSELNQIIERLRTIERESMQVGENFIAQSTLNRFASPYPFAFAHMANQLYEISKQLKSILNNQNQKP